MATRSSKNTIKYIINKYNINNFLSFYASGRSRGGARGARLSLIWGKKGRNHRTKKSQQGNQNNTGAPS